MQRNEKQDKKKDKRSKLSKALERTLEAAIKLHARDMKIEPFAIHQYIENFANENEFFRNLVNILTRTLNNDVENVTLTTEQRNHLMTQLALRDTPIECVDRILKLIIEHIKKNSEWIANKNFIPNAQLYDYVAALEADFQAYKIRKYSPVDDREFLSSTDSLRRMDSLARLFNLANNVSVCTAVGVHNDELLLSFNASDGMQQDVISKVACQRVQVLQEHFATISNMTLDEYHLKQEQLNSETADKLALIHPTVIPKTVIMQAIDKLSHAFVFDDTFDLSTKAILLKPAIKFRVLMPCIDNNQIKICSLAFTNATTPPVVELFETNVKSKDLHVSRAHAEQMLAHFVFMTRHSQDYNADKLLQIGLTKLCCQACRNNLRDLPVEVRGTHGEVRERTFNFIKPDGFFTALQTETPKRRKTQAPGSPPDTAKKKAVEKKAVSHKRDTYHSSGPTVTDADSLRENQETETPSKKLAAGLDKFSIRSRPRNIPSPDDEMPSSEESPRKK
jgi:hypothetical protein